MTSISENRKQAAEVLDKAQELITAKGWAQGQFWKPNAVKGTYFSVPPEDRECFCLLGSMLTAFDILKAPQEVINLSTRAVSERLSREYMCPNLATFNDDPLRTKGDVLEVLSGVSENLKQ